MDNLAIVCVALFLGLMSLYLSRRRGALERRSDVLKKAPPDAKSDEKKQVVAEEERPPIEALADFDWEKTPPKDFRPFRPIYYITMALQADTPSDLVIIDSQYLSRITARRSIIADHPETVHGSVPEGLEQVRELYAYLLEYLPARYPSLFKLHTNPSTTETTFKNTITGKSHPLTPPDDPLEALRILGETVEDDLFLLVETPEGHRMVAFMCCFPSGFDPSSKLGKMLWEIHEPVPAYEKIGASMERYFTRLEVGKSVKRINWSVTTQLDLFNPEGNHIKDPNAVEYDQEVDIETARVRMELQTLTRLPRTKAILFSFKSYLYPVKQIKDEGLGPQFADAIDGLKLGNAPGMWVYKGGIRWGKSVCEYLRS